MPTPSDTDDLARERSLTEQLLEARLGRPLRRLGPMEREVLKSAAGSLPSQVADQIEQTIRANCERIDE